MALGACLGSVVSYTGVLLGVAIPAGKRVTGTGCFSEVRDAARGWGASLTEARRLTIAVGEASQPGLFRQHVGAAGLGINAFCAPNTGAAIQRGGVGALLMSGAAAGGAPAGWGVRQAILPPWRQFCSSQRSGRLKSNFSPC